MKTLLYCLAAFFSVAVRAQSPWLDSIVVAQSPSAVTAPKIDFLSDGTPVVSWGVGGTHPEIRCSRMENGVFSTPVTAVGLPFHPALFGFGGFDMATKGQRVYIVFEEHQKGVLIARSDDGGKSFQNPATVIDGSVGIATLASVTVDEAGNPTVSFIVEGDKAQFLVMRSDDGGLTFKDPVTANSSAPGQTVCECCVSDMLVSGDSTWIVFRNNNNNLRDVWIARADEKDGEFDTATDVDATNWQINSCPVTAQKIVKTSGDSIIAVWTSRGWSTLHRIYASTLHAPTMTLGRQVDFLTAGQNTLVQSQPDIAASGDTIGLVFQEKSREIVFTRSTTGLNGLGKEYLRIINPALSASLRYPALAYRNGMFHLVYSNGNSGPVIYRRVQAAAETSASKTLSGQPEIFMYPNPVSGDKITLESGAERMLRAEIFNAQGVLYGNFNLNGKYLAELETSALPSGVYRLRVWTEAGFSILSGIKLNAP